jgi:hypothetical protein
MCVIYVVVFSAFWGPIAGILNTILWYADSKDVEIEYMPEMRLVLGVSGSMFPLALAFCKYVL